MGGRGSSSGKAGSGGSSGGSSGSTSAQQNIEDSYAKMIGNGRTSASELDKASSPEQVKQIESRMQTIISSSELDKQGKIAFEEAMKNRVEDALIRTTPIRNKSEMLKYFEEIANVDLKPHLEEGKHFGKNFGKSRTSIYIRTNELTEAQRERVTQAVKKKKIRASYTPGFDWISYDFQK